MQWVRACYWILIRFLTGFRYRVRVEGLEKLRDLRGPTLVMPNHPGLIDPPLVLSNVRIPGGMRPIVTTSMYRKPLLYPLMRLVNAVEVPELEEHSRNARAQTLTMLDTIAQGLNRGENFLIYPAGRTETAGIRGNRRHAGRGRFVGALPSSQHRAGPHPRRLGQHLHDGLHGRAPEPGTLRPTGLGLGVGGPVCLPAAAEGDDDGRANRSPRSAGNNTVRSSTRSWKRGTIAAGRKSRRSCPSAFSSARGNTSIPPWPRPATSIWPRSVRPRSARSTRWSKSG